MFSQLIAALLTLACAWYEAGRPKPVEPLPRMASFQAWTDTVEGILHLVGLTNFLDNLDDLYQALPDDLSDIHKGDFCR